MPQKTMYAERPDDAVLITNGGSALAVFRDNIEEIETEDGTQYSAEEYTLPLVMSPSLLERFNANKEDWKEIAIQKDYDEAAAAVRAIRNRLLDETDKEMSLDRIVADLPSGQSITDFLPFLKALVQALSSAMAKYRQALRDVPQQRGFPYNVEWPDKP